MNQHTWDDTKEEAFKLASESSDPIQYIAILSELDVVIDNALPDFVIEAYDKEDYYDEDDGDVE